MWVRLDPYPSGDEEGTGGPVGNWVASGFKGTEVRNQGLGVTGGSRVGEN